MTIIHVGRYDIQFPFSDACIISVQSKVEVIKDGKLIDAWPGKYNWPDKVFCDLYNIEVKSYCIPDDKTISIKFVNDIILNLIDNSDQYESMQIYIKNSPTIII